MAPLSALREKLSPLAGLWKRERALVLGLAWTLLVLVVAAVVFKKTPNEVAKRFDIALGFHWLIATALLALAGFALNAKSLWNAARKRLPPLAPSLAVAAATVFAAVVCLNWIPLQHRVLSDESSWEGMAIQMRYNGSGGVCNQGWFEDGKLECFDEVNNFKGKAMSLAELAAFAFGEPTRDSALRVNLPLFLLSIPLLFLVLCHSTGRPWLAASACAVLATMPTMLFQARAASTEILYVFLLLLVVWFAQLLATEGYRGRHLLLLLPLLGIFAQTRQETVFAFLAFAWYWLPWFRQKSWHAPAWALGAIAASFPILAVICGYKGYNFQGGNYAPHSIGNLAVNFWDNVRIMLGLEREPSGLLSDPFFTAQTVATYLGLVVATVLAICTTRWRRQMWMGLLFFVQPVVIMVNVSGNFNIDINQRYVLTMLPAFAILAAIGIHELFERPVGLLAGKRAPVALFAAVAVVCAALVLGHRADFVQNSMYRKNKLLTEEAYLHEMLKDTARFPEKSLFVYARPWQMVCSGRSAISESRAMRWSADDFRQWNEKTGGNIFLVRGQDGYGKVDRNSRVVGFKTTDDVGKILEKYETETVDRAVENFGYPLVTQRLLKIRGARDWTSRVAVTTESQWLKAGDTPKFRLRRGADDTLRIQASERISGEVFLDRAMEPGDSLLALPARTAPGPVLYRFRFSTSEGDSLVVERDVWFAGGNAALLTSFPLLDQKVGWGSLQINQSVERNVLHASDAPFTWGFGAHADSKISVRLARKHARLRFVAALDDESLCGDGAVFAVSGDGRALWRSKPLYAYDWQVGDVDVSGVDVLTLTTESRDNTMCDHTDWLHPWVE